MPLQQEKPLEEHEKQEGQEKQQEKQDEKEEGEVEMKPDSQEEVWSMEEKDNLFQFVTKIFLMNFPLYSSYKLSLHTSLEELSQVDFLAHIHDITA